jgi:hypothetical protein
MSDPLDLRPIVTSFRHTPAPWGIDDDGSISYEGNFIAQPATIDDFPCLDEEDEDTDIAAIEAELHGNAALMAKAPEMAHAIFTLGDIWDTYRQKGMTDEEFYPLIVAALATLPEGYRSQAGIDLARQNAGYSPQ